MDVPDLVTFSFTTFSFTKSLSLSFAFLCELCASVVQNIFLLPVHLPLTGIGEGTAINQLTNFGEQGLLITPGNLVLQLVVGIEMIFQAALAAAGDHTDIIHPRLQRLFNPVFNQWFTDGWASSLWAWIWWRGESGCRSRRRGTGIFST